MFQDVDLVVEAVFESMKLKKEIFAKLDQVCKPLTILASNTSTFDIDVLAAQTRRPGKVGFVFSEQMEFSEIF